MASGRVVGRNSKPTPKQTPPPGCPRWASAPPRMRRCASFFATMRSKSILSFGRLSSKRAGTRSTSPRRRPPVGAPKGAARQLAVILCAFTARRLFRSELSTFIAKYGQSPVGFTPGPGSSPIPSRHCPCPPLGSAIGIYSIATMIKLGVGSRSRRLLMNFNPNSSAVALFFTVIRICRFSSTCPSISINEPGCPYLPALSSRLFANLFELGSVQMR